MEIIPEGKGKQFYPDLVEALLNVENQWRRIALEFADHQDGKDLPSNRET